MIESEPFLKRSYALQKQKTKTHHEMVRKKTKEMALGFNATEHEDYGPVK